MADATTEYRTSAEISADISAAAASGDTRRLKELTAELGNVLRHNEQAEIDAANRAKAEKLNPLKDRIVTALERTEGLVDFIREMGGVLSFSYTVPAPDSADGPVVTINASAKAASAPRSTGGSGGNTGGGNRGGKMADTYGVPLAELFEMVASAEDKDELAKRVDAATTDKSKNSAAWAVKDRVVRKAIEAGDSRLPARKA